MAELHDSIHAFSHNNELSVFNLHGLHDIYMFLIHSQY
jgi:hypothetical protein